MARGALSELQESHGKGGYKATAAACGGPGHYQVHHLLPCTAKDRQLRLEKSEHLVWKDPGRAYSLEEPLYRVRCLFRLYGHKSCGSNLLQLHRHCLPPEQPHIQPALELLLYILRITSHSAFRYICGHCHGPQMEHRCWCTCKRRTPPSLQRPAGGRETL